MSTRNFPPSFWNSAQYGTTGAGASGGGDLYQGAAGGDHYHPGDWYHQYTAASHRAVHDYHHHHHNMAAQYGSLLLPGSRLHMPGAQCKAMDWQHPSLENPYTSYSTMTGKLFSIESKKTKILKNKKNYLCKLSTCIFCSHWSVALCLLYEYWFELSVGNGRCFLEMRPLVSRLDASLSLLLLGFVFTLLGCRYIAMKPWTYTRVQFT